MVFAFLSHLPESSYYKLHWKKYQKNNDFSKDLYHPFLIIDFIQNNFRHIIVIVLLVTASEEFLGVVPHSAGPLLFRSCLCLQWCSVGVEAGPSCPSFSSPEQAWWVCWPRGPASTWLFSQQVAHHSLISWSVWLALCCLSSVHLNLKPLTTQPSMS